MAGPLARRDKLRHHATMTASDPVNLDLLELAPMVSRVLEIGCGQGLFAAAYRLRNPSCHYVGIETNGFAAQLAAAHIDRVLINDFRVIDVSALTADGPYDLILFGNMRQYLREMDVVLAKAHGLLAPDGHLLLCLLNGAHWSRLADGTGGPSASGAPGLSRSAFVGIEHLAGALEKNAFRRIKQRPVKRPPDAAQAETLLPLLGKIGEWLGKSRDALVERSAIAHHVVIAKRADAPFIPSVHVRVAALVPRFMDVRARLPASYMLSVPELVISYQERSVGLTNAPDGPRIFLVQRPAAPDRESWQQAVGAAIATGWLVVTEYDDHPELVGKVLKWPPERARWLHIAGAHAVQTSTEPLAVAFREHNPEVRAFANAAFTLPPLPVRSAGPRRVFYGALNRGAFSGALAASLAPAIAAHPDTLFHVVHDRPFFDALPTDRKQFSPALDYQRYLEAIDGCDIALLPLAGEDFELFKSDLKYVECASRGAAVIASPAVYRDSVVDGRTGLIAPALEDWAPALDRLLGDDGLRDGLARNAWDDVRDHRMFAAQVRARAGWYRHLLQRYDELHQGLKARCPWLVQG
ncbi:MAG: methyltransferase [Pseudomonadota bacterium]